MITRKIRTRPKNLKSADSIRLKIRRVEEHDPKLK